jgi:hypothetical protein
MGLLGRLKETLSNATGGLTERREYRRPSRELVGE